jgi:hypothetical protein
MADIFRSNVQPMVLYHCTPKKFLPRIRREGLKPHVPGAVHGVCDPSMTWGKEVVWLTADPMQWKHAKHPRKSWRNPDSCSPFKLIGPTQN